MKTKLSPELMLGKAELNRIEKGYRDDGFVLNKQFDSIWWGIMKNELIDPKFDYFKIISTGEPSKFRIKEGYAFDSNRNLLHWKYPAKDHVIPLEGQKYWIKLSHKTETREQGTVSIGGNNKTLMTGVDTKFTEVLRGQKNFPSKIKFLNSTKYTSEYEVLEVIDDTNVSIQGIFDTIEENLEYAVVGTFTNGHQPSQDEKFPFRYDTCKIELIKDTTGTYPNHENNKEFIIGRVSYTNSNGILIEDFRYDFVHINRDRDLVDSMNTPINKLVGVEYVKKLKVGQRYVWVCGFDYKFNVVSSTHNSGEGIIAVTSGSGGVFKSTKDFTDGDFDGWRYFYEDGSYSQIYSSVKQGDIILLFVDYAKTTSGNGLYICPDAEDIEIDIEFLNGQAEAIYTKNMTFGMSAIKPTIIFNQDDLVTTNQQVRLNYTMKNHFRKSKRAVFNTSTWYYEDAFDSNGVLTDQGKVKTEFWIQMTNTVSNVNSEYRKNMIGIYAPNNYDEILTQFETTGVGKVGKDYEGWAICNGNNSTRDLRGRNIVMATYLDSISSPSLHPDVDHSNPNISTLSLNGFGGKHFYTLTIPQLPKHRHNARDLGHSHPAKDSGHSHGYEYMNDNYRSAGGQIQTWARQDGSKRTTDIGYANITVDQNQANVTDDQIGDNAPINNMSPYYVLIFIQKIQ